VRDVPVGEQLCQQHCPVSHVAHEFPQLCEAETEAFASVLGSHVQRLATIAHGDGVCTTCIPAAPAASTSTTPSTSTKEKGKVTS
jgi:predicted ArsR family transcriptional regulator